VSAATALQLPFEVGFPSKPFVLYPVAVLASALLGRTPGFLAVVESSIASGLFFEPVYSFRVTYAIDLLAIEVSMR
jgi:K+-sensing histidine kinase KdpD